MKYIFIIWSCFLFVFNFVTGFTGNYPYGIKSGTFECSTFNILGCLLAFAFGLMGYIFHLTDKVEKIIEDNSRIIRQLDTIEKLLKEKR